MALFKARPQVFVIPNLPDTPPFGGDLVWLSETLPSSQIEALKRTAATNLARPRLFDVQARSLKKLAAAGVRIAFGTDAGIGPPYGWSAHAEIADMVAAGMTPMQAIVAATRTSAEILRLDQLGTLAAGKSADFIVLDANPLDDIMNTRRIAEVYLRGRRSIARRSVEIGLVDSPLTMLSSSSFRTPDESGTSLADWFPGNERPVFGCHEPGRQRWRRNPSKNVWTCWNDESRSSSSCLSV